MQVYRGTPSVGGTPIALTIGNFDGVHLGHQAMLSRLVEAADDLALPPSVLTFDPPPREFFMGHAAPSRLSTLRDKLSRFAAYGVERVYVARFNAALATMSPQVFIDQVLVARIGARWILVGEDFRFGKARKGDLAALRSGSTRFSVEAMRTVVIDGERASSTAVRAALTGGDMARARALLGRPYAISGRVAHGEKLGRRLGFPTANLPLKRKPPLEGIYAVRVHGLGQAPRAAVASVGVRPTVVEAGKPLVEVFVLDFDEAFYGRRVAVEFLAKLRDEARFPDLDALRAQIGRDVEDARRYFEAEAAA